MDLRVWDTASWTLGRTLPHPAARLDGFDSEATAAFGPDGNVLATAGSDTTVILWDVENPMEPRRIGEEWTTYVPGRAYDPPCDGRIR